MNSIQVLLLTGCFNLHKVTADYWSDRNAIIANEASKLPGSTISLSEDEQKVNEILMNLKLKEYDEGFSDPSKFLPSIHFFTSRAGIEESEVFKFIQKVPKGASLHSHSSAMLSLTGLYSLTYMEGLYGCYNNETFKLEFFFGNINSNCEWKLLSQWRDEDNQFDIFLKSKMSLVVNDPVGVYTDINKVWTAFESIFDLISPLFKYRQFLHDYLFLVMQEFLEDNVRYLEIRTSIGETFDSNNTVYDILETTQFYLDTQLEFRKLNPSFMGFRLIYSKSRFNIDNSTLEEYIETYFKLQEAYPEIIAGFDLVGQEDIGEPLSVFADQLAKISDKANFFFHSGETNWYGVNSDLNLIDAVLLNTSRIGHAFAITKHPQVLQIVKEKTIPIELNPLSNQVLKLVDDLRNHVGTFLLAQGYPVVITCDDPTFWGAKGLSYDWYVTFMGMTPRDGDLRILKQLAINSFLFSSLSEEDTAYALGLLESWWSSFIQDILATHQ